MPHLQTGATAGSSSHAERLMRQQAVREEIQQRLELERRQLNLPEQIHPFLTISRQSGTGASAIAREVGVQLAWNVMDREALHALLQQDPRSMGTFDELDEKSTNWILEVFGKWVDGHLMTQMEFVARLGKILNVAVRHENYIFVGRGAQFLLPRDKGLSVRIIAPMEKRVDWAMREQHLTKQEAKRWVDQQDQGRQDFIRSYFHHEEDDAGLYDLVINLAHMDEAEVVDLIVTHCRHRFHQQLIAQET